MTYRKGKTDREHRFIAMEILGRDLYENEVVHHIDGNKRNNSPENLMVMSRSEHAKIHAIEINRRKAVFQMDKEGKVIKKWVSAKKAAESLGLHPGNISKTCYGLLKSTGGFKWKFAE